MFVSGWYGLNNFVTYWFNVKLNIQWIQGLQVFHYCCCAVITKNGIEAHATQPFHLWGFSNCHGCLGMKNVVHCVTLQFSNRNSSLCFSSFPVEEFLVLYQCHYWGAEAGCCSICSSSLMRWLSIELPVQKWVMVHRSGSALGFCHSVRIPYLIVPWQIRSVACGDMNRQEVYPPVSVKALPLLSSECVLWSISIQCRKNIYICSGW